MPYPSSEPPTLAELRSELAQVQAAIHRTRRSTSTGADRVTQQELLVLYERECAVIRRLRRRHRQWRAETRIGLSLVPSDGLLAGAAPVGPTNPGRRLAARAALSDLRSTESSPAPLPTRVEHLEAHG